MTKTFIDELIRNMKKADYVTKASPWSFEGFGEKGKNVRYIGLKLKEDWLEIFSGNDNLLLKFISDRNSAFAEFYLANKPPFIRIISIHISESEKWETLLGEFKRRMKKDKNEFLHHTDSIDNLYAKIKNNLK